MTKNVETPNIIIRTYEPNDKQKTYELFKNSLLSVINFGSLNYRTSKLICLNLFEKYKESKYTVLLVLFFHIVILKDFVIHVFNNNSLYYYLFTLVSLILIWIIFLFIYLESASKGMRGYIDNAISTDFKNPEEWVKEGVSHLWIASKEDEIVGSVGIIPYERSKDVYGMKTNGKKVAELKRMYVSPLHMRKGIASKLIKEVESWCVENGYDEIVLSTSVYQADAISLYIKKGFKLTNVEVSGFLLPNFVLFNKMM